jgi:predicted ribosome quality control (RQC) complex YloA/Tae2 family protein
LTLRARELADVCGEIAHIAVGAPVQKVVQLDAVTVLLGLRSTWLLLSADARRGRMHLVAERPPGTGEAAPPFCMLLRKELVGARLVACAAVAGERAAELAFRRGESVRRLRLFLFGKAAQLVLVDESERTVGAIGPARRTRGELPSPRELDEPSRFGAEPGLSERIAEHYAVEAERAAVAQTRQRATAAARAALRRIQRLESALLADRARVDQAAEKRKWGDLLLAHLREIPRGASSVTLPDDYSGGAPITLALLPDRSARANAERFYAEHKRMARARPRIEARLAETVRARVSAEAEVQRLEHASDEELAAVTLPSAAPRAAATRGRTARRPPYRAFRSSTGAEILVGRGADRNDELTFKVARGSDLWMHTRDVPGAHVVVPLSPGRSVDGETLIDAATLAAHHSSARGEPQVDVAYTLRKHVRKPPRSRPGTVTTAATKTLRVRIEPERLRRLLASLIDEQR